MSMTVTEILERSLRGQSLPPEQQPVFHGEDIFVPDFARLDLAEREELLDQAKRNTEKLRQDLQKQEREKKARAVRQLARKTNQGSTDDPVDPSGPRITNPAGDLPGAPPARRDNVG